MGIKLNENSLLGTGFFGEFKKVPKKPRPQKRKKSQKTLYKKNNLIYNKRVKLEITIFFYKNILERKRKT